LWDFIDFNLNYPIIKINIVKINLQALDAKMELLQDEFSKVLAIAEQQRQLMAQFQVPYLGNHSLFFGKETGKKWLI
jgi:hypothetical protein